MEKRTLDKEAPPKKSNAWTLDWEGVSLNLSSMAVVTTQASR